MSEITPWEVAVLKFIKDKMADDQTVHYSLVEDKWGYGLTQDLTDVLELREYIQIFEENRVKVITLSEKGEDALLKLEQDGN